MTALLWIVIGFAITPASMCVAAYLFMDPKMIWHLYAFAWCMLLMAPMADPEGG